LYLFEFATHFQRLNVMVRGSYTTIIGFFIGLATLLEC